MQMGVHGAVSRGQGEALERIQRSQRHLLGLINQVLNYARLESGNVSYDIENVSVDDVLRTADALIMPQMRSKGVAYQYTPSNRSLTVRADSEKLQQIILNLLANAVKYSTVGEISFVVRSDDVDAAVRFRFEITDQGIGMTADEQSHAFDAFWRASTGETHAEGAGLGLSVARNLARLLGGDLIIAASKRGVGSTFVLTLPQGSLQRFAPHSAQQMMR
jgi:signal transduction histidine kinase